jgi:hypothetical protein
MRKLPLLFIAIFVSAFSFGQVSRYRLDLEVRIQDPLNIPYCIKGKEVNAFILEGIQAGKIKPMDRDMKTTISIKEVEARNQNGTTSLNEVSIPVFNDPAELGLYLIHFVSINPVSKERKVELAYLSITVPDYLPSNYKAIEMPVATVKFDEVKQYLY